MINVPSEPISELPNVNLSDEPSELKGEPFPFMTNTTYSQLYGQKKNNIRLWAIIGIAFGISAFCCLVSIAAIVLTSTFFAKEKMSVVKVLDSYMYAMNLKNAEDAYALFSQRAKRQYPLSKVQELLEGSNQVLFVGYKSLSINMIKISVAANSDPDRPQGIIATVSGMITYKDGTQGSFNAALEKEKDKWRIYNMSVSIPPEN